MFKLFWIIDQSEDNIENGSSKRKSEAGEGDGPDSTDITPKKVKVSDDSTDAVANDGEAIQLEATVWTLIWSAKKY